MENVSNLAGGTCANSDGKLSPRREMRFGLRLPAGDVDTTYY
jgi:hypothetical protein